MVLIQKWPKCVVAASFNFSHRSQPLLWMSRQASTLFLEGKRKVSGIRPPGAREARLESQVHATQYGRKKSKKKQVTSQSYVVEETLVLALF